MVGITPFCFHRILHVSPPGPAPLCQNGFAGVVGRVQIPGPHEWWLRIGYGWLRVDGWTTSFSGMIHHQALFSMGLCDVSGLMVEPLIFHIASNCFMVDIPMIITILGVNYGLWMVNDGYGWSTTNPICGARWGPRKRMSSSDWMTSDSAGWILLGAKLAMAGIFHVTKSWERTCDKHVIHLFLNLGLSQPY